MKILPLAALALFACSAAYAEPKVTIDVPKDLKDPATAAAYTSALLTAVKKVCARATGPVIGVNYFTYKACIADTRGNLAANEPTGLLAARLGLTPSLAVAAK